MATTTDIIITTVGDWLKVALAAQSITVCIRREDIRTPYLFNAVLSLPLRENMPVLNVARIDITPAEQNLLINGVAYNAGSDINTVLDALLNLLRNTSYSVPAT
jgi:hypothetical protein